jgi:uncharacterized protein
MLIDDVKAAMFAAMKAGNVLEKEVLRTALGDATSTGEKPDDVQMTAVLKKLVKSNEETLAAASDAGAKDKLSQELVVLRRFLPSVWSAEQIQTALAPVAEAIKAAASEGPATGIAMKHLKAQSAAVEGKDVSAAVRLLRG